MYITNLDVDIGRSNNIIVKDLSVLLLLQDNLSLGPTYNVFQIVDTSNDRV